MFTALRFAYERLAPNVTNIGLADAGGNIYCAINPVQGNANISNHSDFQTSLKILDIALGVYTPSQTSGSPYIEIAYPVLSFNGDVQTVIFATLGTEWLENGRAKLHYQKMQPFLCFPQREKFFIEG